MYDLEALKRKIKKEGLQSTIDYLVSDTISDTIKNQLTAYGVFINGYLNLSLLYYLS